MKHLIALSGVALVVLAAYFTINIDLQFLDSKDASIVILMLLIGIIATLSIILTLKMIYSNNDKEK
jgi:hypothetical protein